MRIFILMPGVPFDLKAASREIISLLTLVCMPFLSVDRGYSPHCAC
ncbi:MAG: hypothetical protein H6965_02330 [Chromatiaceae bacterium]|nr:hypothetical protein [Chromatiaceae bacterium]